MNVGIILEKYKRVNPEFVGKVESIVEEKYQQGKWDKAARFDTGLTTMLLYEYCTGIEKVTEGRISADYMLKKLAEELDVFRFGDYKEQDHEIMYDNDSCTSPEYKRKTRVERNFGAHALTTKDDKKAIVLFDSKQYMFLDGEYRRLSGIDLDSLQDIRHTAFHEFTHVAERVKHKSDILLPEMIIFKKNDSFFINAQLSPDLKPMDYYDFIESYSTKYGTPRDITFAGISTIEINPNRSSNRIMHNQISEGGTELISQLVMQAIGESIESDRYKSKVNLVRRIFTSRGMGQSVTDFITRPHELIYELEHKSINNQDLLHYISDFSDLLGNAEVAYVRDMGGPSYETKAVTIDMKKRVMEFWQNYSDPTSNQVDEELRHLLPKRFRFSDSTKDSFKNVLTFPRLKIELEKQLDDIYPLRGNSGKGEELNLA